MKQNSFRRKRQKIVAKMAEVFGEKIKSLSIERQEILLDDMVTAFENRLAILGRTEIQIKPCVEVAKMMELETVRATR